MTITSGTYEGHTGTVEANVYQRPWTTPTIGPTGISG
ncbi:MAG: hypothetical protein IH872_00915 [Chloroflexi bacterium]|nr:hypothetical protein [Chloroflexota bacterium]